MHHIVQYAHRLCVHSCALVLNNKVNVLSVCLYVYLSPQASRGQFISFDFYLSEDSDPIRERIAPGQDVLLLPAAEKALRCWKDKVTDLYTSLHIHTLHC